jgi:succinoglycan biosynthesis transport protein ExoP
MQMLPPPSDEYGVALATGDTTQTRFGPGGEWRRTVDASPLEVALRRKWLILGGAIAIAILVYFLLGLATPRYVAEADVRIDLPQLRYSGDASSVIPAEQITAEGVHTEMAALGSPRLAEKAAVAMGLEKRRDFQICPKASLLDTVKSPFSAKAQKPCTESVAQAGRVLLDRIAIGNDKMSYIIQIKASDSNAEDAARIANGFAAAYVNYQRDTKIALAQEADSWLGGQLATVREAMEKADRAIDTYRQEHNLVDLHSDTPGGADTAASRHFSELNTQLEAVQASITEKQSTLAQSGAAGTGLDSAVVQSLLERHGELASALATLRATLGENHPSVQAAASALHRNEVQTNAEIGRTVAAQNGQLSALIARRNAIAAQVATSSTQISGESQARVKLEELQREATTERTLYESLFVRLKQVDAERRLEVANAAIVVEASAPDHPVFPRKMMMTAGAFLAAIGAGVGASFMYELASGRFQGADQVEGEIGLPVLGLFLRRNRAPHDMVVDEPLSLETEAVHAALTQILRTPPGEAPRRGRTILVTSSLPHEGKSSFSVSLGRAAALAGHSVILLDCDLRRPAIARLLWSAGMPARRDRVAVPTGPDGAGLLDTVMTDSKTPLRYLTLSSFFSKPRGLSTWAPFIELWRQARAEYDIVLIDTPPVLATSEATELGSFADDVVMMVALQETPREAANESIRVLRRAGIAVRGTILSKVDLRRQTERGSLYFKAHAAYAQRLIHDEGS